jgi:drug/metabolite transporter (DMT)-like permease
MFRIGNPYLQVVCAALIWGSSGAFVKWLDMRPATFSFFRLAVPTMALGGLFALQRRNVFRGGVILLLVASLLNAGRMVLFFAGYSLTSIGNGVIMLYTWPIFATLYGVLFLKERITRKQTIALVSAFVGIVLMYLPHLQRLQKTDLLGMSSMLGSAALYAGTVVMFKKRSLDYSGWEIIFFQNLAGTLIFAPVALLHIPALHSWQLAGAGAYTILVGFVGFGLFFTALSRIKASTASALAYVEVLGAVTSGILLFNEKLSWNILAGGLLIVLSTLRIIRR